MSNVFDIFYSKYKTIPREFLDVSNYYPACHAYQKVEDFKDQYIRIYGNAEIGRVFLASLMEPKIAAHKPPHRRRPFEHEIGFQIMEKIFTRTQKDNYTRWNTYFLCSVCDPFAKSHLGISLTQKIRDGNPVMIDQNGPRFYDTLHSEYEHHLAQVHGLMGNGFPLNPFIGFSISQSRSRPSFELGCICPYNKYDNRKVPCLAKINFNLFDKNRNPFKAYFRHVHQFHYQSSRKVIDHVYMPEITDDKGNHLQNPFIPLSLEKFKESLGHLKNLCGGLPLNPISVTNDVESLRKAECCVADQPALQKIAVCLTPENSPQKRLIGISLDQEGSRPKRRKISIENSPICHSEGKQKGSYQASQSADQQQRNGQKCTIPTPITPKEQPRTFYGDYFGTPAEKPQILHFNPAPVILDAKASVTRLAPDKATFQKRGNTFSGISEMNQELINPLIIKEQLMHDRPEDIQFDSGSNSVMCRGSTGKVNVPESTEFKGEATIDLSDYWHLKPVIDYVLLGAHDNCEL